MEPATITLEKLPSEEPRTKKRTEGWARLPHNFYEKTKDLSVAVKFFLIYLLSKDNSFGRSGEFYLTDREIQEDLRVGRQSIQRWRKRLKIIRFIDFIPGRYKGSATTYNLQRIKIILFRDKQQESVLKQGQEGMILEHRVDDFDIERVSNQDHTKNNKQEIKQERKEEGAGSASACPKGQSSPALETQDQGKDQNGFISEEHRILIAAKIPEGYQETMKVGIALGYSGDIVDKAIKKLMYNRER